ncbi:MAG: hypothetical protein IV100_13125 [Myxococcales bacterium]|nr:hypothetical protein [Myxococcales bacterium]
MLLALVGAGCAGDESTAVELAPDTAADASVVGDTSPPTPDAVVGLDELDEALDVPDAPTDVSDDDTEPPPEPDGPTFPHCEMVPSPTRATRPAPTPAPLSAGVARRVLDLPIGTPMGGYGARSTTFGGKGNSIVLDSRVARFATRFIPSAGAHDSPHVDALALEVDGERLVFLQTDAVFINENALFAVEQAIAPDGSMRGHVVIMASHSHSSPSNWLPSLTLMPGIDRPDRTLFQRAVASHAEAALAALAALEPARIGFASNPSADMTGAISHDRRTENNPLLGPDGNTAGKDKDHVVWTLRVDRSDGTPMAALLSFPIHGTIGSEVSPLFTSDVPGGIERALSSALGFPVFHIQGAGGDVSPTYIQGRTACPNAARCLDIPNIEVVGDLATAAFAPLIESVVTEPAVAIEVVTRTFFVGHAAVVTRPGGVTLAYREPDDYTPDGDIFAADGSLESPLDEFNAASGAVFCGDMEKKAIVGIPGASGMGAYSSCEDVYMLAPLVGGLYDVSPPETPICDTVRTTASAIRFDTALGGSTLLLTVPGEPMAPFAAYLRGQSPAGPERSLLVGYAQDHVGYVMTAEDWLAGGYEPSINVWGPLEGEMALGGVLKAAALAWTPEREDPERGTSRFEAFPFPDIAPVAPVVTADHGTVPVALPSGLFLPDTMAIPSGAQPAATLPRAVGAARFVWLGGDPAVDFPRVEVERELAPGQFVPLMGSRGESASSEDGAVVLTYTPDPIDAAAPTQHYYAATWQTVPPEPFAATVPGRPFSLPSGRYRFAVVGRAWTDGGAVPYTIVSQPFAVTPAPLVGASAKRTDSAVVIDARLGNAPGLRALGLGSSDSSIALPGPWTVTLDFGEGGTKTLAVTPSKPGVGEVTLTSAELATVISVLVMDPAGNGGDLTVE